jgi:zinc transport system ATP-binding protein
MDNIIELKNLKFSYNGQKLLEDINFTVGRGEFVRLGGPNGSGKSTLVKLLIKELEFEHGSIKLFGQEIRKFDDFEKIGYLPQYSSAVNFPATAMEIMLTGLYSKMKRFSGKKCRAAAEEALEAAGLIEYKNTLIGKLSGGLRQRLMLARILISSPQLIILDEPLIGIDGASAKQIFDLLKRLSGEGTTIFIISHDTAHTENVFDKTYCLAYGSMILLGDGQAEPGGRHTHPIII